ncbi:discoidin domain-containing protein [Microlunatus speluncae]|uniref:discoidin domain-containing protein n=1 Tax=Microlunatus speluncae TaxID=2594267 RepID=UPI0012665E3F|nr:discoidin domain-containing protein [Microlunatus speluncae]
MKPTLTALLVAAMVLLLSPLPARAADRPIPVQVLGITDLHGYLDPAHNQKVTGPNGPIDVGGASYLKAHLDRLRSDQPNSFLVGSGDQFSGWPDYTQAFSNEPTIEVLNELGMDFDVAGNHEFDREFPFLKRMVSGDCYGKPGFDSCFSDSTGQPFAGTGYGYHAANIIDPQTRRTVLPPYWISEVRGPNGKIIPIGFIGLTLPGTSEEWLSIGGGGFEFTDLVTGANRAADQLQAKGVETIIVSAHDGGQHGGLYNECKNPTGPLFDAARTMSPAIDAIFGGHWHTQFNCMIPDPNGDLRPVIEAGDNAKLIGEVQLSIDPATGDVIREATRATNHPVTKDIAPDPTIEKIVSYWLEKWRARQDEPLSSITRDFEFSTTVESRIMNLAADLYLAEAKHRRRGNADLALVPSDIGVDVVPQGLSYAPGASPADAPGRVLYGEAWPVFGISPITTVSLTGTELDRVLEEQWLPPAYGCSRSTALAVSGNVSYRYDEGKPPGQRVDPAEVLINGQPLRELRTYRVATSPVLLLHGRQHGYPTVEEDHEDMVRAPLMGQDVFLTYLRTHSRLADPGLGRVTKIAGTPPPADGPFGPLKLLPQQEIKATATSQGNAAHGPAGAVDGKCSTMWHSAWAPHAPLPQSITLDLGRTRAIEALVYTPRQDADVPNGRISEYRIEGSTDGQTYTTIATGTWDGTIEAKLARFAAGTQARYVRLVGVAGGADYAAATELNLALTP